MNTRDMASEYRLTHWADIMHERQESGLNIKTYCQNAGIHENVYYYWQRKLRKAACEKLVSDDRAPETRLVPSGWSRLETKQAPLAENAEVKIEINGCLVSASSATDTQLLARVCQMLKSL